MNLPSFEETNKPGYDDVFKNQNSDDNKVQAEPSNTEESTGLPSFEETNNPGYDDIFNIRKRKF
jgi:hypothetical protein